MHLHMLPHSRTIILTLLAFAGAVLVCSTRGDPIAIVATGMALAVAAAAWWREAISYRLHRRVCRIARGECPRCGYDVRASTDRCPECGGIVYTHPTVGKRA